MLAYVLTFGCSTNQLPPEETIHKWFMGHPYEALLERSGDSEAPEPLREAHERFLAWRNLSVNKWRAIWRKDRFDVLCHVLPGLLEQLRFLSTPYRSYSYVPALKRGRWADSHGSSAAPPETRFAVLLTLTPIPHYTLLERIVKVRAVFTHTYISIPNSHAPARRIDCRPR